MRMKTPRDQGALDAPILFQGTNQARRGSRKRPDRWGHADIPILLLNNPERRAGYDANRPPRQPQLGCGLRPRAARPTTRLSEGSVNYSFGAGVTVPNKPSASPLGPAVK